jgi:diguanylate cyclase (GGDEF)-like protein/PAS domain S-box-containing protein
MRTLVGGNERHDCTAVEEAMASRVGGKPRKHVLRSGPGGVPQPALPGPNDAPSVAPKKTEQEIQRLHRYMRQKLTEIEQVYQYSPVGLVLMDMDYRFVRINERMAEINGLPVEAHIGRTLRQVLPDLADYIMELYRPVYERGEPVLNVELHGQTRKEPGVDRQWLANFFPFRSETGEVAGLIGAVVDITELKRQETKVRESEERFRSIFETVTDAIFVQDIETGKFIDINQRALDTFGYGREELLNMSFHDLSDNKPPYTMLEAQARTQLAVGGKPQTFEWRCKKKNGTLFWAEIGRRSAVFGGKHHLLSTFHDITIRKNAEASLIKLSQSDALTGLANRGVFVTSLEHAIKEARRRNRSAAVFYLDLDNFKDVNDTLGHPVGDRLLRSVAQRLRDSIRASDIVARFGGDEFSVLMSDLDEPADAGILAQKLVEVMELPFLIDASNVSTSISIGIALYEPDTDAELCSHARMWRFTVLNLKEVAPIGSSMTLWTWRFIVASIWSLNCARRSRPINFFWFISRRWIWSPTASSALKRWSDGDIPLEGFYRPECSYLRRSGRASLRRSANGCWRKRATRLGAG